MRKKKITYLDVLNGIIKKIWRKHNDPTIIKALHAEITVEPTAFVNGKLNPQISEFLINLYLKEIKADPLYNGTVEVRNGLLLIKDKDGNLVAETTSPQAINDYLS